MRHDGNMLNTRRIRTALLSGSILALTAFQQATAQTDVTGLFRVAECASGESRVVLNVSAKVSHTQAEVLGVELQGIHAGKAFKLKSDVREVLYNFDVEPRPDGYFGISYYGFDLAGGHVATPSGVGEISALDLSFVDNGTGPFQGTLSVNATEGLPPSLSRFESCALENVTELLFKVAR